MRLPRWFRNALPRSVQRGFRFAASAPGRLVGRVLARSARLAPPAVEWDMTTGPLVGNGLGSLRLQGRSAHLTLSAARLRGETSVLEDVHQERLA